MNRVIHKSVLSAVDFAWPMACVIDLPASFDPLTIQIQNDQFVLWYERDADDPKLSKVAIHKVGTGWKIPGDEQSLFYIATVQVGAFV